MNRSSENNSNSLHVLLISPEYWGKNFVSKHHYANYLSKNHKVVFIEPSYGWGLKNLIIRGWRLNQINENLWVVSFSHLLPSITELPKFIQKILFKYHASSLSHFLKKRLDFSADLVWSFDPHRFWDLGVFGGATKIYHSVDFHPGAKFEVEAVRTADLFLGIADIIDEKIKVFAKKYFKIGHGADVDNFVNNLSTQVALPGKNKIKAGYIGNFHKHIDYDLIEVLTSGNPDVDFIFIGPTKPSNLAKRNIIDTETYSNLSTKQNVFFIGEINSGLLMTYLKQFDINLLFFKNEFSQIHCNPHKLMSYFYSGNVILSSFIDEYKTVDSTLMVVEKDNKDYLKSFKRVKENISTFNQEKTKTLRKEFAVANSYSKKIQTVFTLLNESKSL